jgi:ABC-type multidrug transport system fused ATPase/permease subunit
MSLLQQGISAMKRINHILLQPEKSFARPASFRKSFEKIEIDRLTFGYPEDNRKILKNISMEIRSGQIVGIAGPVGSGKSTLLQLICGVFKPDPDMIRINGRDIVTLNPDDWMRNISMVPQYTYLFSKSIRDNILMSARGDGSKIQTVIDTAGLTEEVSAFPQKLDQVVGERGITLSGGQKQRIAIARALMKQAPLLIFDDALSSVDSKTEAKIMERIVRQKAFKTFILASHRLSSLRHADVIYVLKDGEIIERGTHDQLVGEKQCYYQMARFQQMEEAPG